MGEAAILSMHALPGGIALLLGAYVLLTKKGTSTHKRNGYIWLGLMSLLSITAIFIQEINPGSYSLIHLLIPWTLFSMVCAIFLLKSLKRLGKKVEKDACCLDAGTFFRRPGDCRSIHFNARKNAAYSLYCLTG